MHPALQRLRPPLAIAHRGGAKLAPENTLLAFRQALERHGCQMLEMDLQVTRDGVLVVSHDPGLDRCTDGEGPIAECSFATLQHFDAGHLFTVDGGRTFPFRGKGLRIPSLSEVLETFPDTPMNIDLKVDRVDLAPLLAAELRRRHALSRLVVGSEHDEVAERLSEELPEACLFFPRYALADFVLAARDGQEPPRDDRFQVLDVPLQVPGHRLVNEGVVAAARRRGLWINVWTVDDPADMRALLDLGVDGIMTDRPDLLAQVLGA